MKRIVSRRFLPRNLVLRVVTFPLFSSSPMKLVSTIRARHMHASFVLLDVNVAFGTGSGVLSLPFFKFSICLGIFLFPLLELCTGRAGMPLSCFTVEAELHL